MKLDEEQEIEIQEIERQNRIEKLKRKAKDDIETLQLRTELATHMDILKESGNEGEINIPSEIKADVVKLTGNLSVIAEKVIERAGMKLH